MNSMANEITISQTLDSNQYLKDHMQEILDRVSATEVSSCIAAAVAAKIAESYKPTDNK